jgi:hypothetical protein
METETSSTLVRDGVTSASPKMTIERLRVFDEAWTRKGVEPLPGSLYVYDDRGVADWSYASVDKFCRSSVVRGYDLIEAEGDKIKLKNAFRKCTE